MTQIPEPQAGMNSPVITQDMSDEDMDKMMASACDASALLKAISHEGRAVAAEQDGPFAFLRRSSQRCPNTVVSDWLLCRWLRF